MSRNPAAAHRSAQELHRHARGDVDAVGDGQQGAQGQQRRHRDDRGQPSGRAIDQLQQTGPALAQSLNILLTFPFTADDPQDDQGDYVNSISCWT